jgi:hypothetical protein
MALIDFLQGLPLWLLGAVLIAWLVTLALVGLWFFRRHVHPRLGIDAANSVLVAPMMQASLLLYSLIAALIAVGVWTRYSDVADFASAEATAITTLWRDLGAYPEPLGGTTRDIVRDYTDQVINRAWPMMSRGEIPSEGVEWMDRLQRLLYTFEPVTESQKILHAETVGAFNDLVQQRRQRLDALNGGLSGVLWIVLLGGAVACIVLCLFLHADNASLQACMLVGLACSLGMVLLVIFALDTPYSGVVSIGPDSYQLIYDQHMR